MSAKIVVSLDAVRRNARSLAQAVSPAGAAFVVKANGYGHGLTEIGRAVAPLTGRLCVYSIDEAVALRDAGITLPLLVMGPVETHALDEAVARGLELALWDTGVYLRAVESAARNRNTRVRVHVKIDTGVARLGLAPAAACDAFPIYAGSADLQIAGIFSHLAAAEELDSPFTTTQLERFNRLLAALDPVLQTLPVRPLHHIAASAAAMIWPQTRLDMARIGIALYGLWPSPQTRAATGDAFSLEPALSFTSELVAVREVEAGTPVGYGAAYHTVKSTRIGVVPLGYADGIPRSLSNRGAFLASGARCPVAGRVCMNMTMIDLDGAPQARAGTPVTLIGTDGAQTVTADDWAEWAGTINYEIVARLPGHLRREYRSTE